MDKRNTEKKQQQSDGSSQILMTCAIEEMRRKWTSAKEKYAAQLSPTRTGMDARASRPIESCSSSDFVETSGRILQELLDTERTYVLGLRCVCDEFLAALMDSHILSDEEIRAIFMNIEEIRHCNERFLSQLETVFSEMQKPTQSADEASSSSIEEHKLLVIIVVKQFSVFQDDFSVYTNFIAKYHKSRATLRELRNSNADFKAFLQLIETHAASSESPYGGLLKTTALSSLLITPVQRIPRYRLLIEGLEKMNVDNEPASQDSTPSVSGIVQRRVSWFEVRTLCENTILMLDSLALRFNECQREFENEEKMGTIVERLGIQGLSESSSRIFIREGRLQSVGVRRTNRTLRALVGGRSNSELLWGSEFDAFLFSDMLLLIRIRSGGQFKSHRQYRIHPRRRAADVTTISLNNSTVFLALESLEETSLLNLLEEAGSGSLASKRPRTLHRFPHPPFFREKTELSIAQRGDSTPGSANIFTGARAGRAGFFLCGTSVNVNNPCDESEKDARKLTRLILVCPSQLERDAWSNDIVGALIKSSASTDTSSDTDATIEPPSISENDEQPPPPPGPALEQTESPAPQADTVISDEKPTCETSSEITPS